MSTQQNRRPSSPASNSREAAHADRIVRLAFELGAIAEPGERRRRMLATCCEAFAADAGTITVYRPLMNGGLDILDRTEIAWDVTAELARARDELGRRHPSAGGETTQTISETIEFAGGPVMDALTSRPSLPCCTRIDLFRSSERGGFDVADAAWLARLARAVITDRPAGRRSPTPMATALAERLDGLSPRERETLDHLLRGASEKEVAARLDRSRHTVHAYVKRIYRRLGVSSRPELLAIFVQNDLRRGERSDPAHEPRGASAAAGRAM